MIQTNREFSKELVLELVEEYKVNEVARLEKLDNYYNGITAITEREADAGKPNNKAVLNYPGYIVDMIQGYFLGKPVSYSIQDRDKELMEQVQDIFNLNDEQDENSELANIMGIKGIAYELLYADEDANIRFNEIDPETAFIVYDNKIIPEPIFGVRFYTIDEIDYIEAYTKDETYKWEVDGDKAIEIDLQEHYFGDVPLIPFYNNKRAIGDFEKVISLIDAMEIATSNSINDLEYFSDAYMYLVNMLGTDEEDIAKIRQQKVILLDEAGEAGFLVKPSNNQDSENVKTRLNDAIHKFAKVPDMSDENFSQNTSGVAMEYKHFGLDQVVANKEMKFTTGLYKRLELICNFLNTKVGTDKYDHREVKINFIRNKPINQKENVEIATMLRGIVSDQTAISTLYMVDDITDEMERIEAEKDSYVDLDFKVIEEADIDEEIR